LYDYDYVYVCGKGENGNWKLRERKGMLDG